MKLTGPPGTTGVLKARSNACRIHTTPAHTTSRPSNVLTTRPKALNAVPIAPPRAGSLPPVVVTDPTSRPESSAASPAAPHLRPRNGSLGDVRRYFLGRLEDRVGCAEVGLDARSVERRLPKAFEEEESWLQFSIT